MLVPDGLQWAPLGHKSGTNGTTATQGPVIAIHLTEGIGTWDCRKFRWRIFSEQSDLAVPLAKHYCRLNALHGHSAANSYLLDAHARLLALDVPLGGSLDRLEALGTDLAGICSRYRVGACTPDSAWGSARSLASDLGVRAPDPDQVGILPALARLQDELWWFRALRRLRRERTESVLRGAGEVCKARGTYASTFACLQRAKQRRSTRAFIDSRELEAEDGQRCDLSAAIDASVSNPTNRRHELMTRIRGFEEVAEALGHVGLFVTLTCPSRMHRAYSSGAFNPRWDGTQPDAANRYLCHTLALIRARLSARALPIYGLRVAEPHQDGTPHHHLLLFVEPDRADELSALMARYALRDSPDEPGARKQRCKVVPIDPSKGSATGYVAKYIAKNIDGAHVGVDLYGNEAQHSALRVDAWAKTWRIRQFAQLGGPPVTVWRELRRVETGACEDAETCRAAADNGDWHRFTLAMGGPLCRRDARPLKPEYRTRRDPTDQVEDGTPCLTRYGDPARARVMGVRSRQALTCSRTTAWRVTRRSPDAARAKPGRERASGPSWTCVDNCTPGVGSGVDQAAPLDGLTTVLPARRAERSADPP